MMMKQRIVWIVIVLLGAIPRTAFAQGEGVAPLRWNPQLRQVSAQHTTPLAKKTATVLTLPFFEDFTDNALFPNGVRWADSEVYINNTMCFSPVSRGVATFDALNKFGRPYDTVNRNDVVYADSLTSHPIDLSANTPGDSIYLSFFYQPQGLGFSPETQDSFMLFFHRKTGGWAQMWAIPGSDVQPFQQVMVAVIDTDFFYNNFQFRFINKASINTNDDVWNLDYVRMAVNRNINDTAVRDLAFTVDPTFLLNDYTAMPYRQFLANANGERAAVMMDSFRNHYGTNASVTYGYNAVETTTGTPLGSATSIANVAPYAAQPVSFSVYTTTVTPPGNLSRIVYRNTFFLQSGSPNEPKANDSIIRNQVFDNYLAYDDGTAEKSYFLNLASSLPGKTAIEFRLNVPDTLRGMAIYFGQQVPTSSGKFFSATVYTKLAGIAGATQDAKLFEQEFLQPIFTDTVNCFTIYRFDSPLQMPAGVFYLGTTQPASSGSDSLYIGLDVNRVGGNHLYYNVLNAWQSSSVSGALMIRPLLGGPITGTSVDQVSATRGAWQPYPNPCSDLLYVEGNTLKTTRYMITDMQGRTVIQDRYSNDGISVASLPAGMYLLRLQQGSYWSAPQKFIKK
jgi:hypothetical protein